MQQPYNDIIDRLGQPLWWDEVGCPRYEPFAPSDTNDIYAQEAALLEIECQSCGERFLVAMSWKPCPTRPQLSQGVRSRWIHYGDPPMHQGCLAGATMNCVDLRVVEFWQHDSSPGKWEWVRDESLEVPVVPDWAKEG